MLRYEYPTIIYAKQLDARQSVHLSVRPRKINYRVDMLVLMLFAHR